MLCSNTDQQKSVWIQSLYITKTELLHYFSKENVASENNSFEIKLNLWKI